MKSGTSIVTVRNTAGQPTSITDPNGVISNLAYDPRGRLTTTTVSPGASQSVTTIDYDAAGQVIKVTAPMAPTCNTLGVRHAA